MTLLWSSPLYHQVCFSFGSSTGSFTTTTCESWELTREAFFEKLKPFCGARAHGIRNRSPDASKGQWDPRFFGNCHNWHMVLRLAPCNFSNFHQRWRDSLFTIHRSSPFFDHSSNHEPRENTAGESSNSIMVTKTSKLWFLPSTLLLRWRS